jgi:hypothetical protein
MPGTASVRVGSIDALALESAVTHAPSALRERSEYLVDLLWEAGCVANEIVRRPGTRVPDVVCSLPGRTPYRIVVLAHMDREIDASGVPRHWRGAALLPFLYQSLGVEQREHSFQFAAFGSHTTRRFLDDPPRFDSVRGGEVRAIVEIVDLGPETIGFWSSDPGLGQDFLASSLAVGRPLDWLRRLERHRLRPHRIPTIAITSPSDAGLPAVGAPRTAEVDTYHSAARLLAVYLGYLDDTLKLRAGTPGSDPRAR